MQLLNDIRAALNRDGLTPDNVRLMSATAYELFLADQSGATLAALGAFRIMSQHLDDGQGVPTNVFARYQADVLPQLKNWLATDGSFRDPSHIDRMAESLAKCI